MSNKKPNPLFWIGIIVFGVIITISFAYPLFQPAPSTIYYGAGAPTVAIESPIQNARLTSNTFKVTVIASDFDGIASVEAKIVGLSQYWNYSALSLVSPDKYEGYLNFTGFYAGSYILYVNATDTLDEYTIVTRDILYRPIHSVVISNESQVNFQRDNCDSGEYILANVSITHNATVQDLDLSLTLPSEFGDATNYHIYRGAEGTIDETPFQISPAYVSNWRFDSYQLTDICYFQIRTPRLSEDAPNDGEYDNGTKYYERTFNIQSYHGFTNTKIEFHPSFYSAAPLNWHFLRQYGIEWVELDQSEVNFTVDISTSRQTIVIQFNLATISKGDTINFRVIAEELPIETTNYAPFWYGLFFAGGFFLIWAVIVMANTEGGLYIKMGGGAKAWAITIGLTIGIYIAAVAIFYFFNIA